MQTQRENPDHHHQGLSQRREVALSPEAELIALARSKGQVLAERTLQIIREALELRGVTLAEFVADVRPHFRNNILNPSGFLIDRARRFRQLSRPAAAPVLAAPHQTCVAINVCQMCHGQKYIIEKNNISPCPSCSTPEFRREWEMKEAERARKSTLPNVPNKTDRIETFLT